MDRKVRLTFIFRSTYFKNIDTKMYSAYYNKLNPTIFIRKGWFV
ncbi:hypothetical protein SAMN05421787_101723 [Virgibacillus pantothenticus]|nr:hypothetical protein SAMN05421787_101723 [Virgibacillus pantothenticus]